MITIAKAVTLLTITMITLRTMKIPLERTMYHQREAVSKAIVIRDHN